MKQLVTVNLTTRTTDWQPPVLTFGESLTLALRFQKTVDSNAVEPLLAFDSARAAIGNVDARPGGGSFALQLPPPPSISTVRDGGETAGVPFNELQQLYIPPDFRGAYTIKKGYQRTALISPDASADEIQATLEAAFGAGNFVVTLPTSYHF